MFTHSKDQIDALRRLQVDTRRVNDAVRQEPQQTSTPVERPTPKLVRAWEYRMPKEDVKA